MPARRVDFEAGAAAVRRLTPAPPREAVERILDDVRAGGDDAVRRIEQAVGGGGDCARVAKSEIDAAADQIASGLLAALRLSIANVTAAATALKADDTALTLEQGQKVSYRNVPVRRTAAYVPGGRGSYPSTAVMCLATARAAGVGELCVFSPARENGRVDAAVLAVCSLLEVDEVYPFGGAQAIAAAGIGTETIPAADVIVGPGNSYVQEAKRQLAGSVGIDSVAGPSELVVVADAGANPELIALDLLAQGEHGPDSLVVLISDDEGPISAVEALCGEIVAQLALVKAPDLESAVALADQIAPEHMQLMVAPARSDALAAGVTRAGALFVGSNAATAFGDYVIGTNHVLPTAGSARFASALSVSTFTRRMAEIRVPDGAVSELADAGATIARGEGFEQHAKSMEARKGD
jgi:histidinol dehydrogenase